MRDTMAYQGVGFEARKPNLKQMVEDFERRLIAEALERTRGNQRRAANELGILPTTLNEKMRRLRMRACDRTPVYGFDGPPALMEVAGR